MSAQLVPQKQAPPSARATAIAAVVGALAGGALALIVWAITSESRWFYAIPICALIGIWSRRQRLHVLWGRRAR